MKYPFIFDLNDPIQFPALQAITPFVFDYERNDMKFIRTSKDLGRVISKTKDLVWAKMEGESFDNLIRERALLEINVSSKTQRDLIIEMYNKKVIERVDNTIDFIYDCIGIYFPLDFKEPEKEELGLKNYFKSWYEVFRFNEDRTQKPNNVKLQWKGQNNQLYNILRQLKDKHELIGNSYESLAEFLIKNVTGFENIKKATIETEFKRKKELPKPKRINIEPGEAE